MLPRCGVLLVILAAACQGTPILDFLIPSFSGSDPDATIYYTGGATSLAGVDIEVESVSGGNPLTEVQCAGCRLNFVTGVFRGMIAPQVWEFEGGGSVSIRGGIDYYGDSDLDDPEDIAAETLLLQGEFTADPVYLFLTVSGFHVVAGGVQGTVHEEMSALFGFDGNLLRNWVGQLNLAFEGGPAPGFEILSSEELSGDLAMVAIPEPGTVSVMAGLVALLFEGARRRFRRRSR